MGDQTKPKLHSRSFASQDVVNSVFSFGSECGKLKPQMRNGVSREPIPIVIPELPASIWATMSDRDSKLGSVPAGNYVGDLDCKLSFLLESPFVGLRFFQ
ncbi:hypothetical protein A9Q96_11595 [Rhodobacterales bacterium 52_120_T64]|nr:hypothetical protein A9Q96_11595 [Rhodobacterales bacterium 52_120_T64]